VHRGDFPLPGKISKPKVPAAFYFYTLNFARRQQQKINAIGRTSCVAASGPAIWTSTYGLEPVLCNRLLTEPSGWAQTAHMFTQLFT